MNFLDLKPVERAAVLQKAAEGSGRPARVLEKDFWVCWTLEQLFTLEGVPKMVFKGGTSLSKVFRVIDRFSEDVDITVDKHDLGFPSDKLSRTALERAIKEISTKLNRFAEQTLVPRLAARAELNVWTERENIMIRYPSAIETTGTGTYLTDVVRVELGATNPIEPWDEHSVSPDLAISFEEWEWPQASVKVLSPIRTFWEKATLLHMEYHRSDAKPTAERLARHYYDLATIADHSIGQAALDQLHMLERVANDKKVLFRAAWANYDEARPGTMRLVPSQTRLAALEEDYTKMVDNGMFLEGPPPWDHLLERLGELESQINSTS